MPPFRQLRRVLQQIVLLGLPVTAAGCGVLGGNCSEQREKTFDVALATAAPPLELRTRSCHVDQDACPALCDYVMSQQGLGQGAQTCDVQFQGDDARVKVSYSVRTGGFNCPVEGRRPAGLVTPALLDARDRAGAWLAQAAWLEAASIQAFLDLARELRGHDAPRSLIQGALAAASDEVRHTELMTALALRYGARPPLVEVVAPGARSLEDLAIDNAAEGCVRETWGAVIALWQSHTAPDPQLRAGFAEIARDEIRHAALSWAIDRWARTRLPAEAHARIDAARVLAVRALDGEEAEASPWLGLPTASDARGLLDRARAAVWGGVA